MATQRQIDANRRNGARSKGPVTAEGKQTSSRNSATHGLTARKIFVLANESTELFDNLVASFVRHYQPATELEHELCLNIAHAHWRIRRLAIIETGMFDRELQRRESEVARGAGSAQAGGINRDAHPGIRLAAAFEGLARENGALGLLTKYESRLQRTFQALVERLEAAQKKRQNEPNLTGPPPAVAPSAEPCVEPDGANASPESSPSRPVPPPAALSAVSPSLEGPPRNSPSPSPSPGQAFSGFNCALDTWPKGAKLVSQQF